MFSKYANIGMIVNCSVCMCVHTCIQIDSMLLERRVRFLISNTQAMIMKMPG